MSFMSVLCEHRRETVERHLHPCRSIAELIAQLVQHLLELGKLEKPALIVERFLRSGGVGGEESASRACFPFIECALLAVAARKRAPFRIAERAQHPGN